MWSHPPAGPRRQVVVTPVKSQSCRRRQKAPMKSVGIREPKTHLPALARAAAKGEPTLLTDYGKPLAVITAMAPVEKGQDDRRSDPLEFRKALLAMPHELDVDF
jgi:antitoxin (DNA-binding transcriptional repressor) of toxin-antitoxin stability system